MNKYNVIFLNIQQFLSRAHDIAKMQTLIKDYLIRELSFAYPDISFFDDSDLIGCLLDVFSVTDIPFVFIIDEWDCIFREYKHDTTSQRLYLDFVRNLLKDQPYVALAYMTGILPIKKYGTHSALNMFDEASCRRPQEDQYYYIYK